MCKGEIGSPAGTHAYLAHHGRNVNHASFPFLLTPLPLPLPHGDAAGRVSLVFKGSAGGEGSHALMHPKFPQPAYCHH